MGITYRDSGVDTVAGGTFVKKIAPLVKSTFSERVITDIGGFGALFSGSFPDIKDPVLVSGTDGVGTKLKIAQMMNRHDTIGIDAVAMCVNDIITSGARPLFFLDYLSCGRLNENVMVDIIKGITDGCKESACSLIGGETAEHPGVMADDDYDIAGFAVGVVDRGQIINGENIKKGDIVIGLPSSGIHSNGYSLVRKLFFNIKKYNVNDQIPGLRKTLGEALLIPTRLYTKQVLSLVGSSLIVKGIIHITGGGFFENIPRILPKGLGVEIEASTFKRPDIFRVIQKEGDIDPVEMYSTFNMGIGLMIIIDAALEDKVIKRLKETGERPLTIGKITQAVNDDTVKINGIEKI